MPKLKIMVTGGAEFIGTNLVRFLLQETEHEVINVDKLTYGKVKGNEKLKNDSAVLGQGKSKLRLSNA